MSPYKYSKSSHFLKAYIIALPKRGRGEATKIAACLGVSTTLISQILRGKKVLTPEQCELLGSYLGFNELEQDYLTFLVHHERSGTVALKTYWKKKIDHVKAQSLKISERVHVDKALTEAERARFYSSPLYSAVRLYASIGENGKSIADICERFDLPRARAQEILGFLVEIGLCIHREGRYLLGAQRTHLEQGSPHALKHHANWRLRAIHQSEWLDERELMYTAPVSLSRADFENLREEMADFIKKFLSKVHASPAEEIACFNMDFFWIKK